MYKKSENLEKDEKSEKDEKVVKEDKKSVTSYFLGSNFLTKNMELSKKSKDSKDKFIKDTKNYIKEINKY